MRERSRRPREERRSQLALLSRLPSWAHELLRQLRGRCQSVRCLREAIQALRSVARLLEDDLNALRGQEQAVNEAQLP